MLYYTYPYNGHMWPAPQMAQRVCPWKLKQGHHHIEYICNQQTKRNHNTVANVVKLGTRMQIFPYQFVTGHFHSLRLKIRNWRYLHGSERGFCVPGIIRVHICNDVGRSFRWVESTCNAYGTLSFAWHVKLQRNFRIRDKVSFQLWILEICNGCKEHE